MRFSVSETREHPSWTRRLVLRGGVLLACTVMVSALAGSAKGVSAGTEKIAPRLDVVSSELRDLRRRLQDSEGQLAVAKVQIQRTQEILRYSTRYRIPADLASSIYDIALSEGIDPVIGFRLVKIESNFQPRALSSASAMGYTQLRLATARFYEPGLGADQLYQQDVNLRIGFRFLRDLMNKYDDNAELALVAYNRGPARVQAILDQGGDPSNGYAQAVLQGVHLKR
ncbi:MAG: transglycosylase SLT domain-containing protein [Gemmatimonadota bacterium]